MTLLEIKSASERYGDNFVKVTFHNDTTIKGVLHNVFLGHPDDPRGYTNPYFFFIRIDKAQNVTEKYNCSEVKSIEPI